MSIHGFESPSKDYEQRPLSLDDLLIEHSSATSLVIADESYPAVGIYKGDVLIVDSSMTPVNNDIVICKVHGEMYCRTINLQQKSISDGRAVMLVDDHCDFQIFGVVTRSVRCHKAIPSLAD